MRLVYIEAEGDTPAQIINVDHVVAVTMRPDGNRLDIYLGSRDDDYVVYRGRQAKDLWNFLKAESTPVKAPEPAEPDGWKHATYEDDKPFPCRYCGGLHVYFKECSGDHEDYRYHCRDCNKMWVCEGADA